MLTLVSSALKIGHYLGLQHEGLGEYGGSTVC